MTFDLFITSDMIAGIVTHTNTNIQRISNTISNTDMGKYEHTSRLLIALKLKSFLDSSMRETCWNKI